MSAFTNRPCATWLRQNGLTGLRRCPTRGMGGMPPMQALQRPSKRSDPACDAVACSGVLSRPEKQKEIPASATNTPGIVTTVKGTNDDGTHCRS